MSQKTSLASKLAPVASKAVKVAEPVQEEEPKKQRQLYVPRTATEFEAEVSDIATTVRNFKSSLYPTANPRADASRAPGRREFDEVVTRLNALKRDYKTVSRQAEQKPRRRQAQPGDKPRSGGFKNPCIVSEALATFIGNEYNTKDRTVVDEKRVLTRALLTSMMTDYVHNHNLRDAEKTSHIVPDKAMRELFKDDFEAKGVDKDSFPHTHVQKLITRHVLPATDAVEYIKKEGVVLADYVDHLEETQAFFKANKAQREASKPKVKKAPRKKAEAQAE